VVAIVAATPDASAPDASPPPDASPADAAAAPITDARAASPWASRLDEARGLVDDRDPDAALSTIATLVRAWPDARNDPEVARVAIGVLADADGNLRIDRMLRAIGSGPTVVDALAGAMVGDGTWYQRHHARWALERAGHRDRADDVGMSIADFVHAGSCRETHRADAELTGLDDARVASLREALADPTDARFATQRACLAEPAPR
jgi:hypothetical protein